MAITGIGSNYNNNVYESTYAARSNETKQSAETNKASTEAQASTRKTAADELSYLSKRYSNCSIVAANYTKGMKYGSNSTTNIAISPQFLSKMASDPELEAEYEGYIADMQKLDEQEDAMDAGSGWHVVARGWVIDKDGGISKWGIVQKDDEKSYLQKMSENAEKIRKQNEEKKEAKAEIEEKRQTSKEEAMELKERMQSAGKEQFGDRFKEAIVLTADDKETDAGRKEKEKEAAAGINMDMKI